MCFLPFQWGPERVLSFSISTLIWPALYSTAGEGKSCKIICTLPVVVRCAQLLTVSQHSTLFFKLSDFLEGFITNLHIKYKRGRYLSRETTRCLVHRLMLAMKLFLHWDVSMLANRIQKPRDWISQLHLYWMYCKPRVGGTELSHHIISSPLKLKLHNEPSWPRTWSAGGPTCLLRRKYATC